MKKAILIVSVGSSHLDVLDKTTNKLEKKIADRFPEYRVCQAFSGEIILKKMKELAADTFYSVEEMLDRLAEEGIEEVIVQPTYIISGQENDKLRDMIKQYKNRFKTIRKGKPLLSVKEDYQKTLEAVLEEAALEEGEALLLVGHGTEHHANTEYQNLEYTAYVQGNRNVFVATLEGHQKTNILMRKLEITGCSKVRLMPLLFVAGKHAKKDISGKENSWKTKLEEAGHEVVTTLTGLGEIEKIQDIFMEHLEAAMEE